MRSTTHPLLILDGADEVGVLIERVARGTVFRLPDGELVTLQAIPAGHKVALRDMPAGAEVHKYGQSIGITSRPVRRGEHVHVQNLDSHRAGGSAR